MKKAIEGIDKNSLIEVTEYGDFYLRIETYNNVDNIRIAENTFPLFEFDRYTENNENTAGYRKATEYEKSNENGLIKCIIWRNGDFESPFTPDSVYNPYLD